MMGCMKTSYGNGTASADRDGAPAGRAGIAVVIDYQNMHLCGWDSYADKTSTWRYRRMLDPVELALVIAERLGSSVGRIVICRGKPDRSRKSYWYDIEQERVWNAKAAGLGIPSTFLTRPMKCEPQQNGEAASGRSEEKGIDIACALAFVDLAYRGEYEHVILCSHDTDFGPALENAIGYGADVAQAYWSEGDNQRFRPIWLSGGMTCPVIGLTGDDYRRCLDPHDWGYALEAAPKCVREDIQPISFDRKRAGIFARMSGASASSCDGCGEA